MFREAFTPTEAQRIAHAACADGLRLDGVRELSQLGCAGDHLNNVERDFHRRFVPALPFDIRPWWIRVPLMTHRGDAEEETVGKFPCFAPHEMMALLHGPALSLLLLGTTHSSLPTPGTLCSRSPAHRCRRQVLPAQCVGLRAGIPVNLLARDDQKKGTMGG